MGEGRREKGGRREREREGEREGGLQHKSNVIFIKTKATESNKPATQQTVLQRHSLASVRHISPFPAASSGPLSSKCHEACTGNT